MTATLRKRRYYFARSGRVYSVVVQAFDDLCCPPILQQEIAMDILQSSFRSAMVGVTLLALTHSAIAAGMPKPASPATEKSAKPLKVFILAGQSNMQGHASISTFDSMADDPKTAPLLKEMRGPDGKPRVCEKVWISSVGCLGDAYSDVERADRQTDGRLRRLAGKDRSGVHVRHHHGEAAGRADPDHQDLVGRPESAHRFPPAQRRAG